MHLIQLVRKRRLQVPNRIPGLPATIAMRFPRRKRAPRWLLLAVIGIIVWGPMSAFGKSFDRSIGMKDGVSSSAEVDDAPAHGDVLVAGFGFQTSISSVITIRTYQARTGLVLSEDSYDLNVQEEAASGETKRDRGARLMRVWTLLSGRLSMRPFSSSLSRLGVKEVAARPTARANSEACWPSCS